MKRNDQPLQILRPKGHEHRLTDDDASPEFRRDNIGKRSVQSTRQHHIDIAGERCSRLHRLVSHAAF